MSIGKKNIFNLHSKVNHTNAWLAASSFPSHLNQAPTCQIPAHPPLASPFSPLPNPPYTTQTSFLHPLHF